MCPEYISQTDKESTVQDQISTHLLWGDRNHSQPFKGVAHCSLMDQFQTFPLLPVIIEAQTSPLPLSGYVFGWPSSSLDPHCCWWPQHFRIPPMLPPPGSRADSLLFSSFHPSFLQGKIQISVSLLREQESRDQHPAAPGVLCWSFKELYFKKRITEATLAAFLFAPDPVFPECVMS